MRSLCKSVRWLFAFLIPVCAWAQVYSGNNQVGVTTRTLPQPFVAMTFPDIPNSVTFTIAPSGGAGGTFVGVGTSVVVGTDQAGLAASPLLTVNNVPGSFTVTATSSLNIPPVTFNVTTVACVPNPVVSGIGDSATDNSTLRFAVTNACAGSKITFTSGFGLIKLGSRLRVDDNLTVQGPGAGSLALDGGGSTRLFFIGGGTVSIGGLTLQNGLGKGGDSSGGGGGAGMGGAIFQNGGDLTVTNVAFIGNQAQGGVGTNTNAGKGGGGFGGNSPALSLSGASGGDLLGLGGIVVDFAAPGDLGGGGGAAVNYGGSPPGLPSAGAEGGFGGGGGYEIAKGGFGGGGAGRSDYTGGAPSSGLYSNGGFAGGGGYYCIFSLTQANANCLSGGGGGAGLGGAIFEYFGNLTLIDDSFNGNSAVGGAGIMQNGQGKGGALFVYYGANASSVGCAFVGNVAQDAGAPAIGDSDYPDYPYAHGTTCPGQDSVDVCGTVSFTSVQVTIASSPSGLAFSSSGTGCATGAKYTTPQTLFWSAGSQCTVAFAPLQTGSAGTQYAFSQWEDGATNPAQVVAAPSVAATTYTATFGTQYLLTTAVNPVVGGTVTGGGNYYNAGSVAPIVATPAAGYVFASWTGAVASASSASTTVTMSGPQVVTANFQVPVTTHASATYLPLDKSTQGKWTGTYGGDGYIIANGANAPPAYATVSTTGSATWTWINPTTDPRALQTGSGASTRIASTYYSTGNSFNISLNLIDGNPHRVALYLLDWDTTSRAETISILDASTNAILDTETFSSFQNGEYASWNITGNVIIQVTRTGGINAVVAGLFFDSAPTVKAPVISAVTATSVTSTSAVITWTTDQASSSLVNYGTTTGYGSASTLNSTLTTNHSVMLSGLTAGTTYDYQVVSANSTNVSSTSANSTFVTPSSTVSSSATYLTLDTATQGMWTGVYGADGYVIANEGNNAPSYASVSFTGQSSWTWETGTSDPRALQIASGSSTRIASTYYGGSSFSINVNLTDGNAHKVALYLLDWDFGSRAETISVLDAGTHAVLSTQSFAGFQNGQYVSWSMKGNVIIQVTLTGGENPVVAGIFFGGSASVAAPVISGVTASSITTTSAVITWTTDQASTSQVSYGTTTAYGSTSAVNSSLVTAHSVMLTGLTAGTTYDYAVISANSASVSSTAGNFTLATASSGGGSSSSASYIGLDTATQGTWSGVYGGDGFIIANGANNAPSYAAVSLTGQSAWTWATPTSDPRAMQIASGSSTRIASTYYGGSSFSINLNLTDGNAHKVALYLLDWDGGSRAETIAILDAATHTVLSTQAFSGFQNGQYGSWSIKGSVIIQVTLTGGENPVVAGIFFGGSTSGASAPVISGVGATNITGTSATISWTTDQASTSLVNYGTTTAYGSASALNSALVMSHSVILSGLTPGVTYDYDVVSANAGSLSSTSSNFTFATPAGSTTSSAAYQGADTTTQGTWTGHYGASGYLISGDGNNLPTFAATSLTGDSVWTFASTTSDPRAPQISSGSSLRIASVFYSTGNSFTISLNLTDGKSHRIALYLLDWDTTARAETITITDAASHAVLDTEAFSSFQNGKYAVWNITGNVMIQVSDTAGINAVVSGIFVD